MKLNVKALAITSSVLWGFGLFFITLWIILLDGPTGDTPFLGRMYRGFTISYQGAFIVLLWGLADGLFAGAVFGWLYNYLSGKFAVKS